MMNEEKISNNKFSFDKQRDIEILECSGRGSTCTTYKCKIFFKNRKDPIYGILKEFLPKVFEIEQFNEDGALPAGLIRPLPAQRDKFIELFKYFQEMVRKSNIIFNELVSNDVSFTRHLNYGNIYDDSQNVIFEIDETNDLYRGIILLPYDGKDFEQCIHMYSVKERLEILRTLCELIDKFHQNRLIICDLKPSNFLYVSDVTDCLKLIDFDSVMQIDETGHIIANQDILNVGSNFFSAPEVLLQNRRNNRIERRADEIGMRSDLYSIGAMLLYFVTYEFFSSIYDIKSNKFTIEDLTELPEKLNNQILEGLKKVDNQITIGFWYKFRKTVLKAMSFLSIERYDGKNQLSFMEQIKEDINILIEIYTHKGVHPEVMMDSAIELSNNKNFFNEEDFEEKLLCDIEEVN